MEDNLLASSSEEEVILPEQTVDVPTDSYVPKNVEEQAMTLAAADDAPLPMQEKVARNIELITSGKIRDLHQVITSQERESYMKAAAEQAATAAAVGDIKKTHEASRAYYEMSEQHAKMVRDNLATSDADAHRIAAKRAAEFAAYLDPDTTRISQEPLIESVEEYGEAHGLRNALGAILGKIDKPDMLDSTLYFMANLPPIFPLAYEQVFRNVAQRLTKQSIPFSPNPMVYVQKVKDVWDELDADGRYAMTQQILNDEYGLFGQNRAARLDFIERLYGLTNEQGLFIGGLNVAGAALDLTLLGKALTGAARKGVTSKVIKEVSGNRYAGEQIADGIANKSLKPLNLNDAEATGAAIRAGHLPYTYAPDSLEGVAPHVQARLQQTWDKIVEAERTRLTTTGLPAEEVLAATKAIEASYSPAVRKEVYAIRYGEAIEGRTNFTVLMQGMDGKMFKSAEAARDAARLYGLADDAYTIVTRSAFEAEEKAAVRSSLQAFHGGTAIDTFKAQFIKSGQGGDSIGHGFSASLTKEMAERFARGRVGEGKAANLFELSLPDQKFFLDFEKKFTGQSAEVKQALARVLTPEEIAALKSKTGREVYAAVAKRLGSNEAASTALSKSGIVGNTSTTLGRDREMLVFSEDVMNKAMVRKEPFVGGEGPTAKAARKAAEDAEDAEANQLMAMFDNDAVRASLQLQKGWSDVGAERLSAKLSNFDNPSVPIWKEGDAPSQFSGAFTPEAQKYYRGLLELVGLENERVLFLTSLEVDKLALRPEFASQGLRAGISVFSENLTTEAGQFARFSVGGKPHYLIGINTNPTSVKGAFTGAHEIGHMFRYALRDQLPPKAAKAVFDDFVKWAKAKGPDISGTVDIAERVFAPLKGRVNSLAALQLAADNPTFAAQMGGKTEQFAKWVRMYDEYEAEQMAKFMTTDARAVSIGEKAMKGWAEKLSDYYQQVVALMMQLFGRAVLKAEPDELFKKMIDEHISNIMEKRVLKAGDAPDNLDFVGAASLRGAPSPAPSFRGPMGAVPVSTKEDYLLKVEMRDPVVPKNGYNPEDIDSMPWIAADPRHGASVDAMKGRVVGVHQTARLRRDISEMLDAPLSALSKKQRERVLAVLEEGDQASHAGGYGKEFSASELLARDFTQEELEAYFSVRQARMLNYFVHNKAMVDSMRRKGLMEVEVYGQGKFVGKALSVEQAALKNKSQVYDMSSKQFVELEAEKSYASGLRLIEAPHGATVDGREVTAFLATEKDATVRTVHSAIHYRPGEFARIYSDNYFIRMGVGKTVNGTRTAVEFPIRTAATEKEAQEFIDAVTTGKRLVESGVAPTEVEKVVGKFYGVEEFFHAVKEGELKDMATLRFHFTREIDDYLGQTLEAHARGGKLFTRDRGEHLGTADRTRAARSNILNPYESLSREVTMVSHFANVTEWKEAQIQRWMDTFGDMLGSARTGNDVTDFFKAAGGKFSHITGKRGLFAERTHRYIMRQVGIQTQEHRWWQSLMRRVGEGVMPYVGEGVGAVIRDANPLNFIRSVNHHFTLGLFNISQLIVQANGMSVAAAIHPLYGAKAAALYPAVRIALMSDNPEVWARISKVAGEDVGKLAQAIRKTGLIDNLRSTSLHNIEDGKMDLFASMPRRAVGTVIEKGAFFFNRGEEAARVIAFDISRREWQKLNPGKDWLSNEGLTAIVSKADDYTMNMTRANLARWQEGAMSIPTQFLQYNIKLLQNIASGLISGGGGGRGFTRSEAVKALAGSIAFYGAAGMGISRLMGEWIPDEVEDKMHPTLKTAIGQGVFAAGLKAVGEALTGERLEVALGSRLGSINFFTDMVYNAYTDPKNIYEAMLGPTRSAGERLGVIYDIASLWAKQPDVTFDDVGKAGMEAFTEQVSSARNLTKAYYIAQGNNVLKDRKGRPIAELSNPEIWAQALGISPAAAYDYYTLLDSKRAHFRALEGIAEMVMNTQKKIVQAQNAGDMERADRLRKALQLMWPQNYGDFMHVKREVTRNLWPYDTEFQKALIEHATKPDNYDKPFMTTTPQVSR